MARFVVTGGAGFIGTHVVERLAGEGHQVVAIDKRPGRKSLAGIVQWHQVDLLTADLPALVAGADYVIHLAGQPGVRESWAQFEQYVQGNIVTTQKLLEALRDQPIRKFVLASTSSVYGEAPMPARENGPVKPISPYGATKLSAEHLCDLYGRTASIPWVALRYFTVYGPGQRLDMAFTRWLKAARDGTPVSIYGDGRQIRDFTYVSDAVTATILAATSAVTGIPINVGGGSPVPIAESLRLIEAISGVPLQLEHLPPAAGDMPTTSADTQILLRELGFQPSTRLYDGLRGQYEWVFGKEEDG